MNNEVSNMIIAWCLGWLSGIAYLYIFYILEKRQERKIKK